MSPVGAGERCLICDLLGTSRLDTPLADRDGRDTGIGHCHEGVVMRLAERFSMLPFITIVDAIQAAVETLKSANPTADLLERHATALLTEISVQRRVTD